MPQSFHKFVCIDWFPIFIFIKQVRFIPYNSVAACRFRLMKNATSNMFIKCADFKFFAFAIFLFQDWEVISELREKPFCFFSFKKNPWTPFGSFLCLLYYSALYEMTAMPQSAGTRQQSLKIRFQIQLKYFVKVGYIYGRDDAE